MKPFHNTGWKHYEKVQAILPNTMARGQHAFSAVFAAGPPLEGDEDVDSEDYMGGGSVGKGKGQGEDMDVDIHIVASSGRASNNSTTSNSKWKFSSLSSDDEDVISVNLAPTSQMLCLSSGNKQSIKPSSSSTVVSLVSEPGVAIEQPSKWLAKIAPVIAISRMQGSINWLTDIIKKSMAPSSQQDKTTDLQNQVLGLLQTQDDGLTTEMIKMVTVFKQDPDTTATYLALTNDDLQLGWMLNILQ